VLRIILGHKRDEVAEEWRKLRNEKLHNLYSSLNIVRVIKSKKVHVAQMDEMREVYRVLVGKTPLGRTRCRWEDNIKIDLQELGCGGMDLIGLAQDRGRWRALVNALRDLRVP
jgi:hypothetical protein